MLAVGADKVAIGSGQFDNPGLVRGASERFGVECVVAVVDVWRGGDADSAPTVWSHNATRYTGFEPAEWAVEVASMGAGEIVLQSIDHDGMMDGYDLDVLAAVTSSVDVPVIASGGGARSSTWSTRSASVVPVPWPRRRCSISPSTRRPRPAAILPQPASQPGPDLAHRRNDDRLDRVELSYEIYEVR